MSAAILCYSGSIALNFIKETPYIIHTESKHQLESSSNVWVLVYTSVLVLKIAVHPAASRGWLQKWINPHKHLGEYGNFTVIIYMFKTWYKKTFGVIFLKLIIIILGLKIMHNYYGHVRLEWQACAVSQGKLAASSTARPPQLHSRSHSRKMGSIFCWGNFVKPLIASKKTFSWLLHICMNFRTCLLYAYLKVLMILCIYFTFLLYFSNRSQRTWERCSAKWSLSMALFTATHTQATCWSENALRARRLRSSSLIMACIRWEYLQAAWA